ncbi:MAG: YqjK-like family protein [Burkholderiales bacterium]|nr:YqjK-like family protein [Burkholderiales bacterium]
MDRIGELQRRRDRLVLLAAAQRDAVARDFRPMERPLAIADSVVDGVQYLRAHPGFVIAGVAVIVALRPRRAFAWAQRGFAAWRTYRWASAQFHRLSG